MILGLIIGIQHNHIRNIYIKVYKLLVIWICLDMCIVSNSSKFLTLFSVHCKVYVNFAIELCLRRLPLICFCKFFFFFLKVRLKNTGRPNPKLDWPNLNLNWLARLLRLCMYMLDPVNWNFGYLMNYVILFVFELLL